MKILVLGGTGAIGVALVQLLAKRGDTVDVTSRKPHPDAERIHYLQGNALDDDFLHNIIQNDYDTIVDMMKYEPRQFEARYEQLLSKTKQYIFFSSSRVYAQSNDPITEDSPRLLDVSQDRTYLATNEYSLAKAREENMLFKAGKKNWTIIRPYITYNTERLQLGVFEKEYWLYRALKGRTIVVQQEIMQHITTLTAARDVADAIVPLIGNSDAFGEKINITTTETICWNDVLQLYLDVIEEMCGKRPKVRYAENNYWLALIVKNPYHVIYDRCYDRSFDNSKVNQLTRKTNYTPVREGLKNCIKDFLAHPEFHPHYWGVDGYMDRVTGEWTSLREIPTSKERIDYLLTRLAPLSIIKLIKKH